MPGGERVIIRRRARKVVLHVGGGDGPLESLYESVLCAIYEVSTLFMLHTYAMLHAYQNYMYVTTRHARPEL